MNFFDIANLKHKIKIAIKGQTNFKKSAWLSAKVAKNYFKLVEQGYFNKVTWPLIKESLPKNASCILDVGCGTGRLTRKLLEFYPSDNLNPKFHALDISKNMMSYIPTKNEIEIIEADAFSMPIKDNKMDLTVSLDFITHFDLWGNLLKEMIRVTKNNGTIIFNYIPEEHIKILKNQKIIAKYPKAYAVSGGLISKLKLEDFAKRNNCTLFKIKPYRFFANNEIFRALLNDNQCDLLTERYNNLYKLGKDNYFLEKLINIEKTMSNHGDCSMSGAALATLKVTK